MLTLEIDAMHFLGRRSLANDGFGLPSEATAGTCSTTPNRYIPYLGR